MTAVVVVVVVIIALVLINGRPGPGSATPADASPPAGATASPLPSPSPATRSGGLAVPPLPPLHPKPTRRHLHTTVPHRAGRAPVSVLNNSRRRGLAHLVATALRGRGWTVSSVGNLHGLVAQSTVYYAPGLAAAARRLAHQFPSVQRVLPRSAGPTRGPGLTLVLTRYWTP